MLTPMLTSQAGGPVSTWQSPKNMLSYTHNPFAIHRPLFWCVCLGILVLWCGSFVIPVVLQPVPTSAIVCSYSSCVAS